MVASSIFKSGLLCQSSWHRALDLTWPFTSSPQPLWLIRKVANVLLCQFLTSSWPPPTVATCLSQSSPMLLSVYHNSWKCFFSAALLSSLLCFVTWCVITSKVSINGIFLKLSKCMMIHLLKVNIWTYKQSSYMRIFCKIPLKKNTTVSSSGTSRPNFYFKNLLSFFLWNVADSSLKTVLDSPILKDVSLTMFLLLSWQFSPGYADKARGSAATDPV